MINENCRLGVGVVFNMLGRSKESKDALAPVKGKRIASIVLDESGDGALIFTFDDGWKLTVSDEGRSCCESRYIKCNDDLDAFVGAILQEITIECGDTEESEYGECHEVQFLLVHTDRGIFTANTHNEHNGYYGGFWMVAKIDEPPVTEEA